MVRILVLCAMLPQALAAALVSSSLAAGNDELSQIPRTIGKQPHYAGTPGYCLLLVGEPSPQRIWLVLDGDTLYVDRNADGDLTDPGKQVHAAMGSDLGGKLFKAGTIGVPAAGKPRAQLTVECTDGIIEVTVLFEGGYQQAAFADAGGRLKFSAKPADAPIIHFGGPLSLRVNKTTVLRRGRTSPLYVCIGAPGLGAGTFATVLYSGLPNDGHAVAEIEIAGGDNSKSVTQRVSLEERC